MKIEVYSKTICPFCHMAKDYLSQQGIQYDEFVYDDDDARTVLYDWFGLEGSQRTVPQIFVVESNGTRSRIGGYTDLINSDVVNRYRVGDFDVEF